MLVIKNGRVIDPHNQRDEIADIFIADGKIVSGAEKITDTIDARGLIVCPGFIDLSAQISSEEIAAAAAGGFTQVCIPPQFNPMIDSSSVVDHIKNKTLAVGRLPIGALTHQLAGKQLSEMGQLKSYGCVAVSNGDRAIADHNILRRSYEYASSHDLLLMLQSKDATLSQSTFAHEGLVSSRLGIPASPGSSEAIAIARDLFLLKDSKARGHFCKVSSSESVELLLQNKHLSFSADTTIANLILTELDVANYSSHCHVDPPLRSLRDQQMLFQGIKQGVIQAICSNHTPLTPSEKLAPFTETKAGMSCIELMLPLALRLQHLAQLRLSDIIRLLTINPAKILNIDAGHLSIGAPADICIFSTENYWTVDQNSWHSQQQNTPFWHWELQGKIRFTLRHGHMIYLSK